MARAAVAAAAAVLALALCAAAVAARSATLFGLNDNVALVSIDPESGTEKAVGAPLPYEAQAQGLSSVDSKGKRYFMIGYNESSGVTALVSVDLVTGKLLKEIKLPFEQSVFVGVGQACAFDELTGEVIVMGRDHALKDLHHLLRVNPTSGSMKGIATLGGIDVLDGPSAFDPVTSSIWVSVAFNDSGNINIVLVGYNTNNGKLLRKIPLRVGTLNYDPVTQQIYGLGFAEKSGKYVRTLVALNPGTGAYTEIADIAGFLGEDGDVTALDPIGRRMVALLQPPQNGTAPASGSDAPNLKFNLVSIDIHSGNVLYHPYECDLATQAGCPWSLGFLVQ